MTDEFKHRTTVTEGGTKLARTADWEATNIHEADGQTIGDVLYFNGTSWIRKPYTEVLELLPLPRQVI
jgi:hypothetical protein